MVHVCNIGGCTRSYKHRKSLLRHQRSHNMPARFNCQYCNLPFKRQQGFYLHQLRCGGNLRPRTPSPPPSPKRNNRPTKKREGFPVTRKSTAFQNANVTYRLEYERRNTAAELGENLEKSVKYMKKKLNFYRRKNKTDIKFNMSLYLLFEQSVDDSLVTEPPVVLSTEQYELCTADDIEEDLDHAVLALNEAITEYQSTGSGWVFRNLLYLDTSIWHFNPIRGEKYHKLSPWISKTFSV